MDKIVSLAINTFRESIRDRIFYSLLVFAVLMLLFSLVLGNLTIGDEIKIIKDFGLASITLFGVLIATFVGISLVYKEMEKRTIYVILAHPISRKQFMLGKYAGLSLTLFIEVLVMTSALLALCYYREQIFYTELFKAIIPIWLELQLILAVAILFSTFVSPFLSGMFTVGVFAIGHLTEDFKSVVAVSENPLLIKLSALIYYVFPNLERLNFKSQIVHNLDFSWGEWFLSLLYGGSYTVLLLIVGVFIFNRRDIK